jgi:predicted transcriptional regulator
MTKGFLTPSLALPKLATMEVHLRPETESRLQELATKSGRTPNDLIEDAMAAYLQELAEVRAGRWIAATTISRAAA